MNIGNTKDLVEICSSILLVIAAYLGLWQIVELKKQNKISRKTRKLVEKRESLKLAADLCDHFNRNIIPKMDLFVSVLKERNLDFFNKAKIQISNDSVSIEYDTTTENSETIESLKAYDVLNAIESFAIYFVSGLANKKLGFTTLGETYCDFIKRCLPVLIVYGSNSYTSIWKLFYRWNNQIENRKSRMDNFKAVLLKGNS